MNKAWLEKIGLTAEALEKIGLKATLLDDIIVEHGKGIEKFKPFEARVAELEGQLTAANTAIADLKKIDPAQLQQSITDWETKFKTLQEESDTKLKTLQMDHRLEKELKETFKVRDPQDLLHRIDRAKIKEEGDKLSGLDEQVKVWQEKSPHLFSTDETVEVDPSLVVAKGQPAGNVSSFDAALLKGAGLGSDVKLS